MPSWTPSSWRDLPIHQQPEYADPVRVESVLAQISRLPPLVHPGEVDSLKNSLAAAGRGEAPTDGWSAGAERMREISSFAYAHKVGARGTAIKLNCNQYGIKYLRCGFSGEHAIENFWEGIDDHATSFTPTFQEESKELESMLQFS